MIQSFKRTYTQKKSIEEANYNKNNKYRHSYTPIRNGQEPFALRNSRVAVCKKIL